MTIRRLSVIIILLFIIKLGLGQEYFQQWVEYKINVRLLPNHRKLVGYEKIVYKNNSPDTLTYIYFHLYPNAYQKGTALAKQQLKYGEIKNVQFNKQFRGKIDSLNFQVNGKEVSWESWEGHKDVIKLELPQPLLPGETIVIETPFVVYIPMLSSRLGFDGNVFSLTQWYPKPAVYDRYGWHPMYYLDYGEFYSEFGSYDVSIEVPSGYIVAATGVLVDSVETNGWLKLRYKQDSVHDFAFFVSDKFKYKFKTIDLQGHKIKLQVYYLTEEFGANSLSYLEEAVVYYSKVLDIYPYSVCSVVEGSLGVGGGMEYPTITIISGFSGEKMKSYERQLALAEVILHEVGHNWLYGILAFNEREYPFLDEGINTYYQLRKNNSSILGNLNLMPLLPYLGYNSPVNLHSEQYSKTGYSIVVYYKTAMAFRYLENYLGTEKFDQIMKQFYNEWKFKHPYPEDLRAVFEQNCSKPLDWFFDDVLGTNKLIDYKVGPSFRGTMVKNVGQVKAPVPVKYVFVNNVKEKWAFLKPNESKIYFPVKTTAQVDPSFVSLDYYWHNNYTNGKIFINKPLKLSIFPKVGAYEANYINFTPTIYWRELEKLMLGVSINNLTIYPRKSTFFINSYYSLGINKPFGQIFYLYTIPSSDGKPQINFSIYADNFSLPTTYNNLVSPIRKFVTKVNFIFWNKQMTDKWFKSLTLGYHRFYQVDYSTLRQYISLKFNWYKFSNYHKTRVELHSLFGYENLGWLDVYYDPFYIGNIDKPVRLRFTVGYNIPLGSINTFNDVAQQYFFFVRYNNTYALSFRHIYSGYGHFIVNVPSYSYDYLISGGLSLPAIATNILRFYGNLAYTNTKELFWEAGSELDLGFIKVYFPLLFSENLNMYNSDFQIYEFYKYYRFTIKLDNLLRFRN